jgi:hypothetical protein
MRLVEVGAAVEAAGGGVVEIAFDLGSERRLIGLDGEQVVGAGVAVALAIVALVATASMETSAPSRPPSAPRRFRSAGMAAVSLLLSATASWPSTRREVVAKAETRCSGARPMLLSWLRREVLPSMATKPGLSGQVSRTQAVKASANSSGSMRFIRMVSQRPPGTPWW